MCLRSELAGLIPDAHLNFEKCLNKVQISRGSAAAWLVLGELEQAEVGFYGRAF